MHALYFALIRWEREQRFLTNRFQFFFSSRRYLSGFHKFDSVTWFMRAYFIQQVLSNLQNVKTKQRKISDIFSLFVLLKNVTWSFYVISFGRNTQWNLIIINEYCHKVEIWYNNLFPKTKTLQEYKPINCVLNVLNLYCHF